MTEKTHLVDKEAKEQKGEVRRNIWLLLDLVSMSFFAMLCSTVPAAFFAREYISMKGEAFGAALVLQTHSLALALTGIIMGKFMTKVGYKKMILFGVLLEGISQILFGICSLIYDVTTYTVLSTILRFLTGTGNAATMTTILALASTEFQSKSSLVLGIIESVIGFAYLIGPLFGALLYELSNGMLLPIALPGILYLLSFIKFGICYEEKKTSAKSVSIKSSKMLQMLLNIGIMCPILVVFTITGTFAYIMVYFTLYAQYAGLGVRKAAYMLSAMSIIYIVGSILTGKIITVQKKLVPIMMVLSYFLYSICLYCFTGPKIVWVIWLGSLLIGLFDSVMDICVYSSSIEYVKSLDMDLDESQKLGCLSGIWISSKGFGKYLISVIGGVVVSKTSVVDANKGIMILNFVMAIVTIAIQMYFHFKRRTPQH